MNDPLRSPRPPAAPAAIAFDLDGTLVDSAGGIAHALNTALHDAGLPRFDLDRIRRWIGDGPDALIARALAAIGSGADGDGAALARHLRAGFDAATLAAPMAGSAVFDGIVPLLDTAARGRRLAVVTNKPTALARAVLQAAGLLQRFDHVAGADRPEQRKPAAALLLQTAAALDLPVTRLLMVGDAAPDVGAARAAGCAVVVAGWGYGGFAPGSDPTFATPAELARWLGAA